MNEDRAPLVWTDRDRRLFRGFMVLTGLGLVVPGVIYLVSWSDTVKAMALVLGPAASPLVTGGTVIALLAGGASFVVARFVRPGSVLAAAALICGSVMHYQWSKMMMGRMNLVPEGIPPQQQSLLEDTILFAANAQLPHIIKNVILIGVCILFFVLAPSVCGRMITRREPPVDR